MIYQNNIRSYKPRSYSLNKIVSCLLPDVINLVETNLRGNVKPVIPNYFAFNRNRRGQNGGGVCTLVKDKDKDNVLKVSEGQDDQEFIVTRHSQFLIPINIINVYGEQECRTSKTKMTENWENIRSIIAKI